MRTLAVVTVLSVCAAPGLEADSPFGDLWRVKGVSIQDGGYGITLHWKATAYQHKLPGHRTIEWNVGDDIRLEAVLDVSCRVPSQRSDAEPLEVTLRLPRHPDAQSQQGTKDRNETEAEFKEILDGGLAGLVAALATTYRAERTPVRVALGGGGAGFSSLLVQYPADPSRESVVEPLESDWILSALVSEVEVDMTVNGEEARAKLRFKPNAGLARAGRTIVEHCIDR